MVFSVLNNPRTNTRRAPLFQCGLVSTKADGGSRVQYFTSTDVAAGLLMKRSAVLSPHDRMRDPPTELYSMYDVTSGTERVSRPL